MNKNRGPEFFRGAPDGIERAIVEIALFVRQVSRCASI